MADREGPTLAQFVRFLPRVQRLGLSEAELRAIPVHGEPPSRDAFLSLGELPPGAPRIEVGPLAFVGTRQIYVYCSEVAGPTWRRLASGLAPHRASGTGGTGMFGNPEEKAVDEENPASSWRILDAGETSYPLEL